MHEASALLMKAGLTVLFCLGLAVAAFSQTNDNGGLTSQQVAAKSLAAYAALTGYSDTGRTVESKNGQTNTTTFSIQMQRTNLFKVHWVQTGGSQTNDGTWWDDGHPPFMPEDTYLLANTNGQPANEQPQVIPYSFISDDDVPGEAATVPLIFFKPDKDSYYPNILAGIVSGRYNSGQSKTELSDGKIDGVDCQVISITITDFSILQRGRKVLRLWIGKPDYLLRQIQSVSEKPDSSMTQTHENISLNPKFSADDFVVKLPEHNSSIDLPGTPPARIPGFN